MRLPFLQTIALESPHDSGKFLFSSLFSFSNQRLPPPFGDNMSMLSTASLFVKMGAKSTLPYSSESELSVKFRPSLAFFTFLSTPSAIRRQRQLADAGSTRLDLWPTSMTKRSAKLCRSTFSMVKSTKGWRFLGATIGLACITFCKSCASLGKRRMEVLFCINKHVIGVRPYRTWTRPPGPGLPRLAYGQLVSRREERPERP